MSHDDEETLARITVVLSHRGPDDSGLHMSPVGDELRVGLGNLCLDPSPAGQMPMSDPERTLWISYNGAIYNYPQLRKNLESKGGGLSARLDDYRTLSIRYVNKPTGRTARLRQDKGHRAEWQVFLPDRSRIGTDSIRGDCEVH